MKITTQKFIVRQDLRNNPNALYIFGDNVCRIGHGGQAKEMRGEPNAFGIVTKMAPTYNPKDFFSDSLPCFYAVMNDFDELYHLLQKGQYDTLVIPQDGIGTGIAKLQENAPLILAYIMRMLGDEIPNKWKLP